VAAFKFKFVTIKLCFNRTYLHYFCDEEYSLLHRYHELTVLRVCSGWKSVNVLLSGTCVVLYNTVVMVKY
jgi:hypothetical protein